MELEEFILKRPYAYHLTDVRNLDNILKERMLLSTTTIAKASNLSEEDSEIYLQNKREEHTTLTVEEKVYYIRDQQPISVNVLSKSLTPGWSTHKFIKTLNDRVFFWPTLIRLRRHFDRYAVEKPVIIRVQMADLLAANPSVKLCRLNSGATRCHPSYGGCAPTRGEGTFVEFEDFENGVADVAEVTFESRCFLPDLLGTSFTPNGPWTEVYI